MITESKKTPIEPISNSIVTNRELLTNRFAWEKYFKVLIFLLYGIFFSLVPSVFIFAKVSVSTEMINLAETIFIFCIFIAGVFSIYAIHWIFLGDFGKIYLKKYYFCHIINSIFLIATLLVLTLIYPIPSSSSNLNHIVQTRLFLYLVLSAAWFIVFSLMIFIFTTSNKRKFPSTFIKTCFSFISALLWFATMVLSFFLGISLNETGSDSSTLIFGIVILVISIVNIALIIYSFIYVKLFKETILADKTEREIASIYNKRFLSFLFKFVIFISLITFMVAFYTQLGFVFNILNPIVLAEIITDSLIIIFFVSIVWAQKIRIKNNNNKTFLSALDSEFILELSIWIITLKATALATAGIDSNIFGKVYPDSQIFVLLTSAISISLLLIFVVGVGVNFPNIKNTTSFITNGATLIVVFATLIVFGSWFNTFQENANISNVAVILLVEISLGSTLNIIFYIAEFLLAGKTKKQEKDEIEVKTNNSENKTSDSQIEKEKPEFVKNVA